MKIEMMTKDYRTIETFTSTADAADYVENDSYCMVEWVVIEVWTGQMRFTVEQFLEDFRYNPQQPRSNR